MRGKTHYEPSDLPTSKGCSPLHTHHVNFNPELFKNNDSEVSRRV